MGRSRKRSRERRQSRRERNARTEAIQLSGRRIEALPSFSGAPYASAQPPAAQNPDLSGIWQILRARRRFVLGVTAVVFVAVAIGTVLQEPTYRATATIEFRKQGGDLMPLEAVFELARIPDQHLETQYSLLRSPALARRVTRELGINEKSRFSRLPEPDDPMLSPREPVPEGLVNSFESRLHVEPVTDSRAVHVSFEAGDPELAARVANSLIANYTTMRVEVARGAVDRLAEQVDSVRMRLSESEEKLQRYVLANGLMLVEMSDGETENIVQERLRQLQTQLTEAEAARYAAESRYNLVQNRNYGALASDVLRELSLRVAELQGEYARLRTTFTDAYPKTREVRRQLDALTRQLQTERLRIAGEVRGEYQGAVRRQELLQHAFDEQKALADRLAARTSEYRILKRDVEAQQQLYSTLQQKQKEAGVSMALAPAEISVVDAAVAPDEPIRPSAARNLPLALIVGLLLGIGLALVREFTNPAVRTAEDIGTIGTGRVPVLGMIPGAYGTERPVLPWAAVKLPPMATALARLLPPRLAPLPPKVARVLGPRLAPLGPALARLLQAPPKAIRNGSWVRIDQQEAENSPITEAFSSLRTSVLFQNEGPLPRSILVTSSQPGEGKTTVSVNLALSIARLGRRVLLIDADLRRPSVHRAFGLPVGNGLAEYLSHAWAWRQLVQPQAGDLLHLLTSGEPPRSPSELLSSPCMHELLQQAEGEYDAVVVDSPALLVNVPDARILAPLAEGVVLVVRSGVTPRSLLRRVLQQAPNLIGLVVNDLDLSLMPSYYARYGMTDDDAPEAGFPLTRAVKDVRWRPVASGDVTG